MSALNAEQIADRCNGIGGSDARSIIMGGQSWRELWNVKTGRSEQEDLSRILRVQVGIATEELNSRWYTLQTGREVSRRGELAVHPTIPYLRANLDGVTFTASGHSAYIDFKHVGKAGEQLVLSYTAQGTHCAIVLGLDWWCLSTIIGNSKWELTEQEVDPFFATEYLEQCARFWGYVERDEEPPEPEPVALPAPRKLRIVQLEDEFRDRWPNWGDGMVEKLGSWVNTLRYHQAHEIAKREIKDLLPDDVGTVIRGRLKVARDRADAVRISLSKE